MKRANLTTIALVLLALLLTTADSWGQSTEKKLVADETLTAASGEKNFRVITSNDKVYAKLMAKYEANAVRQSISYKKDRMGKYKECSVYFPLALRPEIEGYLGKL